VFPSSCLQSPSEAQFGTAHASCAAQTPASSTLLLPAVDVEQPPDTAQQYDAAYSTRLQPSSSTQATSKAGNEVSHDSAVSSSGGVPVVLAGVRSSSVQQGSSLELREDALLEEDASWSNRQGGSHAGGLGEAAWFV
jgi:hypothetical protein